MNKDIKFIVIVSLLSVLLLIQLVAISKIKRDLLHLNLGLLNVERDQYYYHLTDFDNNENIDDIILPADRILQKGQRISIDNNNYEVILVKDKNAKSGDSLSGDQIKIRSAEHKDIEVIVKFQGKTVANKK
jgi:hypothetical protein